MTEWFSYGNQRYCELYDELYADQQVSEEASSVVRMSREITGRDPTFVADIGCGTGRHILELQARNLDGVGFDSDPDMLRVARSKAGAKPGLAFQFWRSDAVRAYAGTFDLALALGDVVNYITRLPRLLDWLGLVGLILKPSGVLVMDALNGLAAMCDPPRQTVKETGRWRLETYPDFRALDESMTLHTVIYDGASGLAECEVVYERRLWTPRALKGCLERKGFAVLKILKQAPVFSLDSPDEPLAWRIRMVCRKGEA